MTLTGRIHKVGDDIDTDQIIPAPRCHTSDESVLAKFVFENLDPTMAGRIAKGDFVFAGANFGGGSAREQAPLAIKGAGVACVVAASLSRTFYRNAINIGLPILISPDAARAATDGGVAQIDIERGVVELDHVKYATEPFPPLVAEIIAAGGLVNYVRNRLRREADLGSA